MKSVASFLRGNTVLEPKKSNETVLDQLGDAAIRVVVKSILKGGNLRDLTEDMTRKRILMNNVALLLLYYRMRKDNPNVANELTAQVSSELASPGHQHMREILLPFVGMTKKGWDNIVRGEAGKTAYLKRLDDNLREIEAAVVREYGAVEAAFSVNGGQETFSTADILRCLLAVGSQTLAIRGSEKSIYGKLFERLVLGSVLTLLGFTKIEKDDCEKTKKVFWLSDSRNKRECDATAIVAPGICIRFDIGFIGKGNSEISLDKVSRYENAFSMKTHAGMRKYLSHTIIIVDTLGAGSKTQALAKEIGGDVIQMNGSFWVKELAETIQRATRMQYKSPLYSVSNTNSLHFIESGMAKLNFAPFLPAKLTKT